MSRPSAAVPLLITFGTIAAVLLVFALIARFAKPETPKTETPAQVATPTPTPPEPQEVTQVIDAVALVGKNKKQAEKALGAASSCSQVPPRGEQCFFAGGVTVLFARGRADWIYLTPRPGVYSMDAINLVGIEAEEARIDLYEDTLLSEEVKIRELFYPTVRGAKGASVSVYRDGSAALVIVYGLNLDPRFKGLE